ncbi:MAG: hypothetical protein ACFCVE_07760 [Phycisphaerae bacterium]
MPKSPADDDGVVTVFQHVGSVGAGEALAGSRGNYCMHGLAMSLTNAVPGMAHAVATILGGFEVDAFPPGFTAIDGRVEPYDVDSLTRRLPAGATRVPTPDDADDTFEIYQEGERFWRVDERWGICEVNLLKRTFRSYVLESRLSHARRMDQAGNADLSTYALAEAAVLWPASQLMLAQGLHLVPATALAADGWGVLLVGDQEITADLRQMIAGGFSLIGQRWAALRAEDGLVAMLRMPAGEGCRVSHHAFCDHVVMINGFRREDTLLRPLAVHQATAALQRIWPARHVRRTAAERQLVNRLAETCRVDQVTLGRNVCDLAHVINGIRPTRQERTAAVRAA